MSKRAKMWIIIGITTFLVASLTTLFLVLFLPKNNKLQLETPSFLNFQQGENGTRSLLITDNNLKASGYIFYIYDGEEEENTYDYIEYTSENCYLDVSDIFVNACDYHFFCKAVGSKRYTDSKTTSIKSFSNKYILRTPTIILDKNENDVNDVNDDVIRLVWSKIENATSYSIYVNGSWIYTTSNNNETECSLNSYLTTSSTIELNFYVVANGNGNFITSARSNLANYKNIQTLSTVTNVKFDESNDYLLKWDKVTNASGYQIIVNNAQTYSSITNSYDFSSIINLGYYTFKIKALGVNNYSDGNYSTGIDKTFTEQFSSPTELVGYKDENNFYLVWKGVEHCLSYTVTITVDDSVLYKNIVVDSCGINFDVSGLTGSVQIKIWSNGFDYYLTSNSSIYSTIL